MNICLIVLTVFLYFTSAGCQQSTDKAHSLTTLKIAASSNIQQPLAEICELFQSQHSCNIDISIASSGTLAQQIIQGAPYDIFLSANAKHAHYAHKKAVQKTSKPIIYALGQIALFSHTPIKNFSINSLSSPSIQSIALPLPKLAPYGQAAVETMPPELYQNIKLKLIYTDNTQQTLHYLKTHQVQAAFIHQSALLNPAFNMLLNHRHSLYIIDHNQHKPIEQSIVTINHQNKIKTALATQFQQYLLSKEAQAILLKYNYIQPSVE